MIAANSTVGQFLSRATASTGSFFLVPWPDPERQVVIAFGLPSGGSRLAIPEETSATIQIAALAAWSTVEAHRLRNELIILNERLGRRKLVERAKGLLQANNHWTEQQAYEELRKMSRQRRKTLAETAQDVLSRARLASNLHRTG